MAESAENTIPAPVAVAATDAAAALPQALNGMEERVAREVIATHRERLDWFLRVPAWAGLHAAGIELLGLPGPRQGIGLQAALLALPLESKHLLVRSTLERCQHHVASAIGRRLCRLLGLELFDGLDLDELLTARQWQKLRAAALFRLAQEHRRYKHAQQLLFTTHQGLVAAAVQQIAYRGPHRDDCTQEGALGLLAAIDRVDASTGCFAAYAATWIRRHVRNYLLRQRLPVQAPVNLISGALALRQALEHHAGAEMEDQPPPTGNDAAGAEITAFRLRVLLLECLRHPAVALDEPRDPQQPQGGGTWAECLPDPAAVSPAEAADHADLRDAVDRLLEALTDKQREVVEHRFGFLDGAGRSLSEIARTIGISHQQAGMRERRAIDRLSAVLAPLAAEWYEAR